MCLRGCISALIVALVPVCLYAQTSDNLPSFTLAASHNFSTHERPAITLIYRGVESLDFRIYKVNDSFAFFEKLRDAHHLGGEKPIVPQERTWLERIALWKADRRSEVRQFVRRQFSPEYRKARLERADVHEVVQRRTVNVNSFAQVPLLNASQLVTSWRELLPPMRDAEYRRVPLDVNAPGIYVVEGVNGPLKAYTVVVISDVGLVTKTAPGQLLVFAANRFSGSPLGGCRVRVIADQKTVIGGTTESDGTFEGKLAIDAPDSLVTLAECAGQTAATDPGAYSIRQPDRELAGYIYTDRPVYRPGHIVRFKGVMRWRGPDALALPGGDPLEVTIVDPGEKVLLRERKSVDEFGALNGSFTVPQAASLGYYSVRVASGDATASGSFEVQEYRKPEFDVAVAPASRFVLQGGSVNATITARYYFGQPVAGAAVKYVVHIQPYFSPQRYEESGGERDESDQYYGGDGGDQEIEGTARLNDQGTAEISVPLKIDQHGRDYTARIEARVTDESDREVAGAASVNATYGRFLVMVQTGRYILSPGDNATFSLRAVDYTGNPQAGVSMHVALERVAYPTGGGEPVFTVIRQASVSSDSEGRVQAQLVVPQESGSYRVRVSAPSEGRQVSDTTYIWIPGRTTEPEADSSDRVLELIADRKSYQPGDTARLIIRGAEFESSVLVTKEVRHVSFHTVVKTRSNEEISVPVTDQDAGDTYVSIAFLKDDRLYRAERRLSVPASRHQLTVTAAAEKAVVRPGEPGVFALRVIDATGAPVRAQLSVGLVDEAVYGVRPDETPNPLRFFYRHEYSLVDTSFSRDYSFVGYSGTEQLLLAHRRRPMSLAEFKADRPDRPRVRKDFPDTAFWAADVTTGTDGTATVRVDYPDSLTSWRLTVRAVTVGTDVGDTRTNTTTTKDVIVRVVTPRFLTEGDQVTIPAIVHNYLPDEKTVSLSLSADGLTPVDAGGAIGIAPRSLQVASSGQQRSDWLFKADQVRQITLSGRATTDTAGDAVQLSLPVLPAGLQRTVGSSGSIVEAGERRVALTVPPSANESGRSIRVSLAPSLAGAMLGALDYLNSYPWGCTEQTLSSFVPNLVVLRALSQMEIAPAERLQALDRQVDQGLKRLYDYQHDDGGWGWWKTDQNHPFMTAYALDGLLQARENNVTVDVERISNARNALQQLFTSYPRALPDLKAYEVYVLARAAATPEAQDEPKTFDLAGALNQLWSSRQRMTASGRALLVMTLDQQKDSRADTAARELADAVQTRGDISWWAVESDPLLEDVVDTSVEASALALKALAPRDPKNPLLERTARWLVLNRTAGGYWVSTKQTALALEGLLAYMNARGERPAPVTAEVFVNGQRVATEAFDAKSLTAPNPATIEVPAASGANDVRIVKREGGALYYDASVRYYDKPAASERTGSRRLALLRSYSLLSPVRLENGRIVYREAPFNGAAHAGDLVLVRLTAAGSSDWRYLMLEDPIPAGTEPIEREGRYELEQRRSWWYGSERELRDDRVVFFLSDFTAGRYEMTYMLKVTTPGTFRAMPAHISPMYVPDVSASSDVMTIAITDEGAK
jgi:alpha-2-macroglobulin